MRDVAAAGEDDGDGDGDDDPPLHAAALRAAMMSSEINRVRSQLILSKDDFSTRLWLDQPGGSLPVRASPPRRRAGSNW